MRGFSLQRMLGVLFKEFIQVRRDRVTIGMMVIIPLIELFLFGFAINVNPHYLPTVIVSADHTPFTRQFIVALQNTKYFRVVNSNATEQQAANMMRQGTAQFVVNIPANFTRDLIAGHHPSILVIADTSEPSSTGSATAALEQLVKTVFNLQYQRGLSYLKPSVPPFNLVIHNKYNPSSITQYAIVPGLIGVILTMTLVMLTALAVTKEREWGTMEGLLATPVTPTEVMVGKVVPYVLVGYVQLGLILISAKLLFHVPYQGSVIVLLLATLPFIVANLTLGLTFSTLAENQLQAVQMSFFFFLPSVLLSGFMFPFYGMPGWAQWIGNVLPLTYYTRIVRGITLKGSDWADIWPSIWPILVFIVVSGLVCVKRYRRTLD